MVYEASRRRCVTVLGRTFKGMRKCSVGQGDDTLYEDRVMEVEEIGGGGTGYL